VFRANLKMEAVDSSNTTISAKVRGVTCQKTVITVFTDMGTSNLKNISYIQYLVRVPGYRSRGPGLIPGGTRFSER
jgi:hypothetical protein